MEISTEYTSEDHASRESDVYALAKYRWTLRYLKSLKIPKNATIGNIGCGTGTFSRMLVDAGYNVYAVEPDPAAFEIARRAAGPNCVVENLGVFDIPDGMRFSAIVFHDVLEHIENDEEAIKALETMLDPQGALILSVPALQSLFGKHDEELGHYRRYSRRTLTQVVNRSFENPRVRYFGFLSIPIVWTLSRKLRRSYPAASEGRIGIAMRLYGLICSLETRIKEPLGTSLLLTARKG